MALNVIDGGFHSRSPDDLSVKLRALADAVDNGEVTDLVATYVQNDKYMHLWSASNADSIAMSAIQQANAVATVVKG